jgi:zinc transport system substrate-binding protein
MLVYLNTNYLQIETTLPMKKSILIGILLTAVLVLLSVLMTQNETSPTEASEGIVTSFYPLYYFTSRIVEDTVPVHNLAGSQDVHDYSPTRADMERMLSSRLVIVQGAGMETWTEDTETMLGEAGIPFLVVAEHLALTEKHEEDHDDHTEDELHKNEEAHENEAGHHEEETGDVHAHGSYDPHTWLDPVLAQEMVREISEALKTAYPEHNTLFTKNTELLLGDLATLHSAYTEGLRVCEVREAIVSHDATGYLASRYNLTFHAIAGISTNDEPSAKLLSALKMEAEEGIHAILVEESAITKFAETLARETGLETYAWNPLGRGPLSNDKEYLSVMYDNLASFKSALHCTQ